MASAEPASLHGAASASSGEMEGWLKKKSPKTSVAKKAVDAWQKRYFVLSGGELRYYKSEKAAHMSNGESLKSIRLEQVLWATVNPRHPDAFVIDLGHERKVKLQASNEAERDAWVTAIEAAKRKASASQAENSTGNVMSCSGSRTHLPPGGAAASARPFGTPVSDRVSDPGVTSPTQIEAELLRSAKPVGCCVIS